MRGLWFLGGDVAQYADIYQEYEEIARSESGGEEDSLTPSPAAPPSLSPASPPPAVLSSAERRIFSRRNSLWSEFSIQKPRCARPDEDDWRIQYRPIGLEQFECPTHSLLHALASRRPRHVLISGGDGKTATAIAFARALKATSFTLLPVQNDNSIRDLETVVKTKRDKNCIVCLDNVDRLTSRAQHRLATLVAATEPHQVCFILVNGAKGQVAESIGAERHRTATLSDGDSLRVVLRILVAERVGYERAGIQLCFVKGSLSQTLANVQKVYSKWHFVSEANARKEIASLMPTGKPCVRADAALPPDLRCHICTLRPPCRHMSETELAQLGAQHRARLPERKNSLACRDFLRCGCCRVFNEFGRCSLDHPKKAHRLIYPASRCPTCTLPWPCHKCPFSAQRDLLQDTIQLTKRSWISPASDLEQTLSEAGHFLATSLSVRPQDYARYADSIIRAVDDQITKQEVQDARPRDLDAANELRAALNGRQQRLPLTDTNMLGPPSLRMWC